ncbi:LysR family transcriptional regulator [Sphingomonas sp. NBWT7]|uniref:LysR family transcriptional regulator n=1 Tax=Sphingomonas sp. NBWT7 TaxID=2596913 RepID=UPI0016275F7E|nr:LysR family transcriptional regulator [Sphingomonas sp. NBWT7]QNE30657.1 LysR family transcriptional regulator [Sphingomonas sp. NBWT7]
MIDRYHLRYFLAVVDTGNFSRAAAACNVSQPTLSVGIAKLEKALGHPLFNRTNRRVALTQAGARLLDHARMIEGGFAAAERAVAGAAATRTVRIGVLSTISRRTIEAFLVDRLSRGDGDRVEIVEGQDRDLRGRLARGRIDVALLALRDADISAGASAIVSEGYSLALSITHPLAGRTIVAAEELANDAMIVRRHCELLSQTSRFFIARGVRPFFAARTTSDDKALAHVRAGLGITVMPNGFREPGIARVPLDTFDFVRALGLVFAPHHDAAVMARSSTITALIAAVAAIET